MDEVWVLTNWGKFAKLPSWFLYNLTRRDKKLE